MRPRYSTSTAVQCSVKYEYSCRVQYEYEYSCAVQRNVNRMLKETQCSAVQRNAVQRSAVIPVVCRVCRRPFSADKNGVCYVCCATRHLPRPDHHPPRPL